MKDELKKTYMDEERNILFLDEYLDEIIDEPLEKTDNLQKILEQLIENTHKKDNQQDLKNISEKFILEKFNSKNCNAPQWIKNFEQECHRFNLTKDQTKIEVLRLFLEKSCVDWYSSTATRLTVEATWEEWRNRFLLTFANRGWGAITYAHTYTYKDGSLIDYAMKKERLLLDVNKTIDTTTLIDCIVVGLPGFIRNRIEREGLTDTTDLFNEIRKHESSMYKKNYANTKDGKPELRKRTEQKEPCKICNALNKGTRYHPEETCWFKIREKNNTPRVVGNNSVLEVMLNTETKNE